MIFPLKLRSGLAAWLRRDGLAVLLYILATAAMTYPVAFKLGEDWLAKRDIDTYVKIWDQWWFGRLVSDGLSIDHTRDLFYPTGLDLTYHSVSWSIVALARLVAPLLSETGAYNLTILGAVFLTAYGGYLLIRPMVEHRAAAWLGGAVYSFAPYHVAHTGGHPDLVHLAPIPIAVLLFIRALSDANLQAALGTAVMLAIAAFTGLYILDFALITLAPLFVYLALEQRRWRTERFWTSVAVLGIAGAAALAPRLATVLRSPDALASAIEEKYEAADKQTDLLSFAIPSHFNPIFAPYVGDIAARFKMNQKWPAYLGLVPLALTLSALTWKGRRRLTGLWLAIGLLFVVLSLGPVLRFNGQVYSDLTLPAAYVAWFPPIRAVARPDYFVLGLLLPLAVCAARGFDRWLAALGHHSRAKAALAIGVSLLLLFEYWNGEYPGMPASVSRFYTQLASEDGEFAIIDLPMGRENSKEYVYFQTVHHRPIVEGLSARTPPEAYRYIDANPLLARWRFREALDCSALTDGAFQAALDPLIGDGFRYVVVHHRQGRVPRQFTAYFTTVAPVYRDDGLTAYALADLRAAPPCRP